MALNYVTVSGCTSASSGGAIKNYADMAVKNTTFKNNTSDNNGGAIFSGSGAVTKVEAALESNGFMYADGNFAVPMENPVVVEAGAPSVDDGVIKGSMNYLVKGVEEA